MLTMCAEPSSSSGATCDIRAAVKPFFTHFTAGRQAATAHAVVDVVGFLVHASPRR